MDIIEVNKENSAEKGFFCYMSKKKSEGYQRKLEWLKDRFDGGMKIRLLDLKQGGKDSSSISLENSHGGLSTPRSIYSYARLFVTLYTQPDTINTKP